MPRRLPPGAAFAWLAYFPVVHESPAAEMNPFQALLKPRKFLVLLLDTTVSPVLYFLAKYLAASAVEDIKTVILALQPVVLVAKAHRRDYL